MFEQGTKVKTNNYYFEKYGRTVIGITQDLSSFTEVSDEQKEVLSIVRWDEQTGNIIPEHQNNCVLMMNYDLELV